MNNEQFLWSFFTSKGCNSFGAAGLIGNMFAESSLISTNLQNSFNKSLNMTDAEYTAAVDSGEYTNFVYDKAGYGLVQWTFWSLKEELLAYAKQQRKSIGDLQMQAELLWQQLNTHYTNVVAVLQTAKTVLEASNTVLLDFERPADQSAAIQAKRAAYGEGYYKKYVTNQKGNDIVENETYQEMGNGYIHEYQPATKGKYWNLPNIKINGLVLHSVGCPQPSAQAFANNFNKPSVGASVHGFIEPGKFIETAPTRVSKGTAKKCYHVGGSWNNNRIGIEMCEPSTIKYVGGATWIDLNLAATKEYLTDVIATAAKVFADLCIYHGINPSRIQSHAEAYQAGCGSNHGDPNHLFKAIGYTMDQFRQDVKTIINERNEDYLDAMTKQEFENTLDAKFKEFENKISTATTYKYLKDIPDWGRKTIEKCIDKGFISGSGKDENGVMIINISDDLLRTIVINDRAGIYDKK